MYDVVEKFVDVPGGYLYLQTRGHGDDVVLVNAGAGDSRMGDTTVPWLSEVEADIDASLTVLPEADHFPMLSAPQQFEKFLREALA